MNAIAVRFQPEEKQGSGCDGNRPPQRRLPGAVDVVVFINGRLAAQQHKLVRMATVTERRHCPAA
jgi:hypothetical protein